MGLIDDLFDLAAGTSTTQHEDGSKTIQITGESLTYDPAGNLVEHSRPESPLSGIPILENLLPADRQVTYNGNGEVINVQERKD